MSDTLIVATGNKGKLREIRSRLASTIQVMGLSDLHLDIEVVEDAETFDGNALKKAAAVFKETGLPCLADDSGLEVDALNGQPGVYSARFGGPNLTDAQRAAALLDALSEVPDGDRSARFRAVLAYLSPGAPPVYFSGTLEGRIARTVSGDHGFGYDPIFIPTGYEQTLAVLGPEIKSRISHRAQALDGFQQYLLASH